MSDDGAPPIAIGVRVHNFASDGSPISGPAEEERLADIARQNAHSRALRGGRARKSPQPEASAPVSYAAELVKKFPAFDVNWSDEIKARWFEGFARLMAMQGEER